MKIIIVDSGLKQQKVLDLLFHSEHLSEDKYAVLEWENHIADLASVIATEQEKHIADSLVKLSPPHLYREVISMKEYEQLKEKEKRTGEMRL